MEMSCKSNFCDEIGNMHHLAFLWSSSCCCVLALIPEPRSVPGGSLRKTPEKSVARIFGSAPFLAECAATSLRNATAYSKVRRCLGGSAAAA